MSVGLTPIGAHRWTPRWAAPYVDGVIAVSVGVLFVIPRVSVAPGADDRAWDALSVALIACVVAPIAWRRRWPTGALAATILANTMVIAVGEPETGLALVGYFLAFSATLHRQDRPLAAIVAVAVGGVALQALAGLIDGTIQQVGSTLITDSVALLVAIVISDNVLRRRERVADAESRAVLLTREHELEKRAAITDERTRIARELHDIVAHSVSIIVLQSGAAQRVVHRSPDEGAAALRIIEQTARSAMTELRSLLDVLRDEGDAGSIASPQPTLDQLPALIGADPDLDVTFVETGARPEVSAHTALTVYRIVQEAMTNARKHSPGAPVMVNIDYTTRDIVIDVANRAGAQSAIAGGRVGHGLIGVRERIALAGGAMRAGPSDSAGGWTLHCTLPVKVGAETPL